jgi:hypothetical protein
MNYKILELIDGRIRLLDGRGITMKFFTKEETMKFIEDSLYRVYGYEKEGYF